MKWEQLRSLVKHGQLEQQPWPGLPDGGQHRDNFSPSALALEARPAGGSRGRRGGRRGKGRDGVRGTWMSKGSGKVDSGEAATGGKVEGGFASMGPDRKKLCH